MDLREGKTKYYSDDQTKEDEMGRAYKHVEYRTSSSTVVRRFARKQLGRPRLIAEGNIKMNIQNIVW